MTKNLNGYRLATTADKKAVKGGLSHANGNCIMVTRLSDGNYTVTDSKLGAASPVWQLTEAQFHRFGELVARWLSLVYISPQNADLGDGAMLAIQRGEAGYVFSLTGHDDLSFTPAEYRAFCWGYVNRQFCKGEPVRRLEFTV